MPNASRRTANTAKTRVFLGTRAEIGDKLDLPADEAHHIFKVLRSREGEVIEVVTSDRSLMLAEVHGDVRSAEARVLEKVEVPDAWDTLLTLYQAVPKAKHMDLVVEKATELGAKRIVPLLTEHGEVRPSGDKVGRWLRLAESAARQSLQLRIPQVSEPEVFHEAVEELRKTGERGVILHNGGELPTLEEAISTEGPLSLFVGPEGGWSEGEIRLASELGIRLAQMGPYRLRAETAGIVGVARTEARLRHVRAPAGEDDRG